MYVDTPVFGGVEHADETHAMPCVVRDHATGLQGFTRASGSFELRSQWTIGSVRHQPVDAAGMGNDDLAWRPTFDPGKDAEGALRRAQGTVRTLALSMRRKN
jgi:hypothetical protein